MAKNNVYATLTQVLSYGVCNDAPLVCCHECECLWSGTAECFVCGHFGEILAVPKQSGAITLIAQGMLSDQLVVVSSDLSDFLNKERSRLTRRSSGMESIA